MTKSSKRPRTQQSVGRILGWGGSAIFSLLAVAFVSQTERGAAQIETALFGTESSPAATAAQAVPGTPASSLTAAAPSADINRLTAQLRQLTADRDRLAARLASLEQHLGDATGSIGAQRTAAPAAPEPKLSDVPVESKPPEAAPSPVIDRDVVRTVLPDVLPKLAAIAAPTFAVPAVIEPLAMSVRPETASWVTSAVTEPEKPVPAPEAAPDKPPVLVNVPLPPIRVAAAPHVQRPPPPPRMDYAVDIGGSIGTENLAAQWMAVKANLGPLLTGLRPAVGRDHRFGRVPYRLLVGPLASPAAAARLCVRLAESGIECRPARFEGEQLAQF